MLPKFFVILLFVLLYATGYVNCLQLKKVVVFSRHNVRAPLSGALKSLTSKEWPEWKVEPGFLTPKGARCESYMGEYFSNWLAETDLLPHKNCSEEKYIYVYANSVERTIKTAKVFSDAAFPNCKVMVNSNSTSYGDFDRVFQFFFNNDTDAFKLEVEQAIRRKLDNTDLRDVYATLNDISDIKNSVICKSEGIGDLTEDKDIIVINTLSIPKIDGRFQVAVSLVDAFLMSYYEGFPFHQVAWGLIKSKKTWNLLSKITNEDQNIRFNFTEDIMKRTTNHLVEYVKETLQDDRKVTVLVGHDTNIRTLLTRFNFKPFMLPQQFELTPVGGRLVFQKWSDGVEDFLKIEYVYQSIKQLRKAQKLSMKNPPRNVTMYLKTCLPNNNGMCPWSEFEKILNDVIH